MEIRSIHDTPPDAVLPERLGIPDLRIWWLLGRDASGTDDLLLQVVDYPPGTLHDLHRHPGGSEVLYVMAGRGMHLTEAGPVEIGPGQAVHIPVMEWHGLENPFDEMLTFVGIWPGIGGYEELGLEDHPRTIARGTGSAHLAE
jgi:quercetin dioxygenase-like cupin family protein